jgi:hypothetical protein
MCVLQDIKGSDIFSDDSSGTGHAAGAVPGLSDAKKRALYSTSVFGQDDPAAAPQVKTLSWHQLACMLSQSWSCAADAFSVDSPDINCHRSAHEAMSILELLAVHP